MCANMRAQPHMCINTCTPAFAHAHIHKYTPTHTQSHAQVCTLTCTSVHHSHPAMARGPHGMALAQCPATTSTRVTRIRATSTPRVTSTLGATMSTSATTSALVVTGGPYRGRTLQWAGDKETPSQAEPQHQPAGNPPSSPLRAPPNPEGLSNPTTPTRPGGCSAPHSSQPPGGCRCTPTYHSRQQGDKGMAEGVTQGGGIKRSAQAQQSILQRKKSRTGGRWGLIPCGGALWHHPPLPLPRHRSSCHQTPCSDLQSAWCLFWGQTLLFWSMSIMWGRGRSPKRERRLWH